MKPIRPNTIRERIDKMIKHLQIIACQNDIDVESFLYSLEDRIYEVCYYSVQYANNKEDYNKHCKYIAEIHDQNGCHKDSICWSCAPYSKANKVEPTEEITLMPDMSKPVKVHNVCIVSLPNVASHTKVNND